MLSITLRCKYCEKQRIFSGKTIPAITGEIDRSGWVDSPTGAVCDDPKCEQLDRETHSGDPE